MEVSKKLDLVWPHVNEGVVQCCAAATTLSPGGHFLHTALGDIFQMF